MERRKKGHREGGRKVERKRGRNEGRNKRRKGGMGGRQRGRMGWRKQAWKRADSNGCSLMLVFTALTLRDWSRLEESYANDRIRGLVKCDAGQAFAGKGKLSRFITLLGKWGLPVFSFLWFLFQGWCVVFFRKFIRTQIFKRNLSKRISGSVKDTKQVNWKKIYIVTCILACQLSHNGYFLWQNGDAS